MTTITIPSEWFEYNARAIDIFGRPSATPAQAMRTKAYTHLTSLQRQLGSTRDQIHRARIIEAIREVESIIFWLNGIAESTLF